MYTRHFYKEDEVFAALLYATAFGRVRETLFWTQELLDTNLGLEAIHTLIHSWLLFRGIGNLQWLDSVLEVWNSGEIEDNTILLLAYQLASLPPTSRDSTVMTLMCLTLEERKEKSIDRLLANGCEESVRDEWEKAILRAAYQKKTETLWLLLRKYWWTKEDTMWSLLEEACGESISKRQTLQKIKELEILLNDSSKHFYLLAIAVGSLCLSDSARKQSFQEIRKELDDHCKKSVDEWVSQTGYKIRREYSIPRDCLYWITARGNQTYLQTTVDELPELFLYLESSEYWKEALDGKSFDDLEMLDRLAFLETYFPDGHPMTWSKEEIAKSHGDGCLGPTESISVQKWQRIWIRGTESRVIWKGWSRASKIQLMPEIGFEEMYKERKELWEDEYNLWNLTPCIKRLVVL